MFGSSFALSYTGDAERTVHLQWQLRISTAPPEVCVLKMSPPALHGRIWHAFCSTETVHQGHAFCSTETVHQGHAFCSHWNCPSRTCLLFHWNCPSMFFSHHPSLFLSDLSQKSSLWLTKKQSACNTLWKKGENDGKNVKNRLLSSRHQLLCLWIEHRVEPEVCLEIGSCQQQFCFRHVFVCMFALRCMFSANPPCEHRQDLQGDTFKHQVPDWVLQASRLCFHPSVFSQRPYSVALKFSVCPRTAGLSVMKETKQNACSCICVCKDLDTLSIACWSVSHVIVQVKQSSSLFCTWAICVPYLKNKGKEKEHMTIMTCFWHKKPKEWPPCLAHRLKQSKRLVDC